MNSHPQYDHTDAAASPLLRRGQAEEAKTCNCEFAPEAHLYSCPQSVQHHYCPIEGR